MRYVYNWGLCLKREASDQTGKRLYCPDVSARHAVLKRQPETIWLNQVSSVMLQQSLRHRDRAFCNFFKGGREYPRVHTKRGNPSAPDAVSAFPGDREPLTLAKVSKPLNMRGSRYFNGTSSTVTVSKDVANRYFVSIRVEDERPLKDPLRKLLAYPETD